METGATPPVDILPIFKYIPERLFGNCITRSCNVSKAINALYGKLVSRVMQRRLMIGNANSFFDGVLDQQDKLNLNRNELNFLCGVLMDGGSDTSSSMILAFLYVMIKYPEV